MSLETLAWLEATSDLRESLHAAAYEKAISSLDREPTAKDRKAASWIADGEVLSALWKTEEYNGMRNPSWDDPIWRDPKKMAGYTPLERKEAPRPPVPRPAPKPTKTDIQRVREALRARKEVTS